MKGVIYRSFEGAIQVEHLPEPKATEYSVVLKVLASGLCRSDWHGWMGHDPYIHLPHVPGHELAGEIVELGSKVRRFKIGDRVTVPFVCGCGTCPQCQTNNHQVCDHQSQPGFTHWGSFAEYVRIDYADTNLVLLPDSISDTTAAILGCRFITSFRAIVDQGKVTQGQCVAVHGCGGVGLSAIMIAASLGAEVIAIDIDDDKLGLCRSLGASHIVNARSSPDVVAEVIELSQGGAHVSVDALGSQATCYNSVANLRKRGKHIQVGLTTGDHQHPRVPMDKVIACELEIIGSHGMQAFRYDELLKLITDGRLRPELLIRKHIPLEQAPEALSKMDEFSGSGVTVINQF